VYTVNVQDSNSRIALCLLEKRQNKEKTVSFDAHGFFEDKD
jgi:hypothetical protein